jgi:hypothetical protein
MTERNASDSNPDAMVEARTRGSELLSIPAKNLGFLLDEGYASRQYAKKA